MKSRPLLFLFDSVHILKCIRNNWLGQKDTSKYMLFPKFCHNGNHKLVSKMLHFEHYKNFMPRNHSEF